ncbi:phosphoglycerate mutase family [Cordyceps militaris]|uniref:Phosphoglycerate mutase family n=1 Tax=Cordyceps militaris TaxID=73501 RepID=A0A2H4SQ32_CORMI|nr:phosphoglycerate mutase family [Cordyceps militaris]
MVQWTFSAPEGYFDDCAALAAQLPNSRLTTRPLFALTPRDYPSDAAAASKDNRPWARFTAHVAALNREAPANVSYKIMFLTRHGEGYHNLMKTLSEDEQGEENHDAQLPDEAACFDAFLTPVGVAQATALSGLWLASIAADGLPVPQTLYTSPLARCLQTGQLYLQPIMDAHSLPYGPLVKERLRERLTMHSGNKRRPRAWIAENWPACVIEEGFSEEDVMGTLPRPETEEENRVRVLEVLADVFEADASEVVAWTFHSLSMRALLGGLGMVPFKLQPATTIAVLVRGEKGK